MAAIVVGGAPEGNGGQEMEEKGNCSEDVAGAAPAVTSSSSPFPSLCSPLYIFGPFL